MSIDNLIVQQTVDIECEKKCAFVTIQGSFHKSHKSARQAGIPAVLPMTMSTAQL